MTEADRVAATSVPGTRDSLAADLRSLGLPKESVVLVHSSLSALGRVVGGAVAAAQALFDAIGRAGTLVVPTHSGDLSDPAGWERPPIPQGWWETVRATMPAFDPAVTPPRGMGAIADGVRRWLRWPEIDMDASVFNELGPALDETGGVTVGTVGVGSARLMRQRAAVDFGVGWLRRRCGGPTPA